MRKLFRKGERVRSKIDGKVMEVLKYIKNNFVEVKWFDLEKKESGTKLRQTFQSSIKVCYLS
jgi:uncharacterized protein YodC (DUF2158 family)